MFKEDSGKLTSSGFSIGKKPKYFIVAGS